MTDTARLGTISLSSHTDTDDEDSQLTLNDNLIIELSCENLFRSTAPERPAFQRHTPPSDRYLAGGFIKRLPALAPALILVPGNGSPAAVGYNSGASSRRSARLAAGNRPLNNHRNVAGAFGLIMERLLGDQAGSEAGRVSVGPDGQPQGNGQR